METILRIEDLDGDWDGYRVITDKQTITLGIENGASCCEVWGHFWMNDKPEDFIGAHITGVTVTDEALNTAKLEPDEYDERSVMFVNIETDRGTLQFTAYNSHNGYYGHTAKVVSEQLKHEEVL